MMRKKSGITVVMLLAALFSGLFLCGQQACAGSSLQKYGISVEVDALKTESAVNDCAGLYTEEEIRSFEEKMQQMREEYDCNAVAFIIDDDNWDTSEISTPEEVSEEYLRLDDHKSTVVLWLNVCRENRSLYVLGYGSAEWKINDSEADDLARTLQDYVKRQQGNQQVIPKVLSHEAYEKFAQRQQSVESGADDNVLYVEMMDKFISRVDEEMRRPYFFLTWWFHLGLGIAVGLIVVFMLLRNVGGKMTVTGTTYMNKTFSQVLGRRDIYTHTTTVRTKRSSSSGGSRGGGGGHSHSSGGGRF